MNRPPVPLRHPSPVRVLAGLLVALVGCAPPDADPSTRQAEAFLDVVALEDARPLTMTQVDRLVRAAHADSRFVRAAAVRALGRLERPDLVEHIVPLTTDPAPEVRAAAVRAGAQAVQNDRGDAVLAHLLERLDVEHDPEVLGAIGSSIGRLRVSVEDRRTVLDALMGLSRPHGRDAPPETMVGVALGLEAVARNARDEPLPAPVVARLSELVLYRDGTARRIHQARVRTLAVSALGANGRMTADLIRVALRDESPQVGATAGRWVGTLDEPQRGEALRNLIFSRSLPAQIEALRFIASQPMSDTYCAYVLQGAAPPADGTDAPLALRVLSIDALRRPCPELGPQRRTLVSAASPDQLHTVGWQPATHALAALAGLFPSEAEALLPAHVESPVPFVRARAAATAAALGNTSVLRSLLEDPAPNVRTAALTGLGALTGRGADAAAIRQLEVVDPQLVMTASAQLEGSDDPAAVPALLDALDRMSDDGRETFRDGRRAILARIAELGDASVTARLTPYLTDYDPLVAEDVAAILQDWNRRPYYATPVAPVPQPLPDVDDMARMSASEIVMHMAAGGAITIELHPWVAPTNAWRFFRQAEEGYFDGLTLHRWVPNFVIQGGSPNANEYYGDGPFSRDEVGLHHWRGTVGVSTRGHDTGDGQIFVNLIDNVRLDHLYTVIGTVVDGMDAVDRVNEGSVIERVEVRPRR